MHVSDRWNNWHNLAEAVVKEVATHSICWGKTGPPPKDGVRAATTRERRQQAHALLDQGVGLLECARRLGLALTTVKRYARISELERLVRDFAALSLPFHNGGTEGVNTKTIMWNLICQAGPSACW
ncbi:hypothetical protein AB0G05_22535 [Nonomuraea wenchangensis]